MAKKPGSTRALKETRLDRISSMIASSVPVATVIATLAKEWNLTTRQLRNLVRQVDERHFVERRQDAPYVRERQLLRAERLTAKCIADRKHGAAVQSLALEAKLAAALEESDPELDRLVLEHGPPPKDPALSHIWLQRTMLLTLYGIQRKRSIDPVLKLRLIADYGVKSGLMGDKASIQEDLRQIRAALALASGPTAGAEGEPDAANDPAATDPAEA